MAITTDDLSAFHNFAQARIASGDAQSLHELVDIWEIEHPAPELHAQNVAAVQAAIRDMQNGDTGRPAGQVLEELRASSAAAAIHEVSGHRAASGRGGCPPHRPLDRKALTAGCRFLVGCLRAIAVPAC